MELLPPPAWNPPAARTGDSWDEPVLCSCSCQLRRPLGSLLARGGSCTVGPLAMTIAGDPPPRPLPSWSRCRRRQWSPPTAGTQDSWDEPVLRWPLGPWLPRARWQLHSGLLAEACSGRRLGEAGGSCTVGRLREGKRDKPIGEMDGRTWRERQADRTGWATDMRALYVRTDHEIRWTVKPYLL